MYQELENKALELLEENVNYDEAELGCNWGMEELKNFLKSHLKEAYEAGKEEERNTPITKEWYDHLFGEACQQAIAEERERLKKWAEEMLHNIVTVNRKYDDNTEWQDGYESAMTDIKEFLKSL